MNTMIQQDELLRRCMGEQKLADKLLLTFREVGPELLAPVPEQFIADDFAQVASAAHTLKGASASIGAEALRAEAEALEHAARREDKALAWAALERTVDRLRETLREIVALTGTTEEHSAEMKGLMS